MIDQGPGPYGPQRRQLRLKPAEAYLVAGICLDVLYILPAYLFFSRTYRYAVRIGLMARTSAESVS